MHDMQGITSDLFAQRQNRFNAIDARVKMVFILLALSVNLLSPTIHTPLFIAVASLTTLGFVGVQTKLLAIRLVAPLVMAATVVIVQMFFYGHSPLFTIHLWHFQIVGYHEGLSRGLLIMSRVIGGVSLILLLSMSTPINRLLGAARWFKISPTFVELALLSYRYVFVLLEEAVSIRNAQKVRLGYHKWRRNMSSVSSLGGSLILRAYDRSERVFEAMLVRGYTGVNRATYCEKLRPADYLAIAAFTVILAGLCWMGKLLQ
jgi:cobalt/nickel transport system permease protein